MSFTLRQVQPLLTKPELELFHASRPSAIKEFTLYRLGGKVRRARALRDKYRDVYRRQTVRTQTSKPQARRHLGGENQRTETKAEIMDEVLKRFEAQQLKLQNKLTTATKPPATKRVPSVQQLVKSVRKAAAQKPEARSVKAPLTAARKTELSSAPTDISPAAKRVDPLKAKPVNKKIHASIKSRTRAVQAKRDAR